jgi:hypothetical protein
MEDFLLTENEEKITHYCEDFCPICNAIAEYNRTHYNNICCTTEMCNQIVQTYTSNKRLQK